MKKVISAILIGILATIPQPVFADQQSLVFGGDTYAAGQTTTINTPALRDAFEAGYDVTLAAPVTGNAHLAGYDVHTTGDVGGDLYAAGFSVSIGGSIKGDLTVLGNSISLQTTTAVPGNVRAAGATVVLNSEIGGAALITANTATINAPIKGDLSFYGETLSFGPNATVAGRVLIHAPKEVTVPTSVASADRVSFTLLTSPEFPTQMGQTAEVVAKGFWATVWAITLWWGLLFVVGVAFIMLGNHWRESLETLSVVRPLRRVGLGLLGFAAVVGLIPVLALTLVGLLLVPIALVVAFLACSFAYVVGVYLIGRAITIRFVPLSTAGHKVAVLAASFAIAGLFTLVPFLGWLLTLTVIVFGFGVMGARIISSWSAEDKSRLVATPAPVANLGS
jgi:cytoskeletal protein CcmA (bactofilin family)